MAVKDGRIVAVGKKAAVLKAEQGKATRLIDLAGRTLVPGFVDAHGHNLGPGQRLTPMEGLHAMAIWPAYQHFEEAAKGSIEPGKKAVGRKSTQSATWEAHLL